MKLQTDAYLMELKLIASIKLINSEDLVSFSTQKLQ
jgi:hypothetical protein